MTNKEKALITYKMIKSRKEGKKEGKRQAEKYATECACNTIANSAKWKKRHCRF